METPVRKVQLSSREPVIELSDEDCVLDVSCGSEVEFIEPGKSAHSQDTVVTSQSADSGIASQSSVEGLSQDLTLDRDEGDVKSQDPEVVRNDVTDGVIVIPENADDDVTILDEVKTNDTDGDSKGRLLLLEEEVQQLRAENESLKLKTCSCQNTKDALITIKFSSLETFSAYKHKICKLFDEYVNLELDEQENNLLVCIYNDSTIDPNEWVIVDGLGASLPLDKRKKRRKRKLSSEECESSKDVFVLDTTPSLSTKHNLRYESKFDIASVTNKIVEEAPKGTPNMCFNCDGTHNLRDCPHPRDHFKINTARQKFKPQNKQTVYKRYHVDLDQRFEEFRPGKMSSKLQQALGLRYNQLPEHIYRMRKLGYPPGWFSEFMASKESNLVLFDFNGKDASRQKAMVQNSDVNEIIDYHGFNVPLQKGFKDEHRLYDSPPYSTELSKSKMLTFLNKFNNDNLNLCDMEIDAVTSDKEVEIFNVSNEDQPNSIQSTTSPTLCELEFEKKKLLEQLTEDVNSNSFAEPKSDSSMANGSFITIDETGVLEADNTLESETNEASIQDESPVLKTIKTSYFGTPILKSASPYSHLPNSDNFTKDVSDVINFENLPNSTGKYEQMVGVLKKVRRTLLNKKS